MPFSPLPPAATYPGYCPVCRDIVSVADELNCCHPDCAWNGQANDCTPPAHVAPVVTPADSVPAPVEVGGGECIPGESLDAATHRVLRGHWRRQVRTYGRVDEVTRDTFQRLRLCSAYLIGRGC